MPGLGASTSHGPGRLSHRPGLASRSAASADGGLTPGGLAGECDCLPPESACCPTVGTRRCCDLLRGDSVGVGGNGRSGCGRKAVALSKVGGWPGGGGGACSGGGGGGSGSGGGGAVAGSSPPPASPPVVGLGARHASISWRGVDGFETCSPFGRESQWPCAHVHARRHGVCAYMHMHTPMHNPRAFGWCNGFRRGYVQGGRCGGSCGDGRQHGWRLRCGEGGVGRGRGSVGSGRRDGGGPLR